ncbi:hypothetical protein [Caulobacter sp. DWR1-3-2b1]|uniref:hypothetical protein n=1 Tax=Caulobacter sp. DWR1-3-2b1 TaxID=2804670 RepID=UPI003CEE728C
MIERRAILPSMLLATATPIKAPAEEGVVKGRRGGPNMIKSDPPKLDFGGGLIIPLNASIFRTLWEG